MVEQPKLSIIVPTHFRVGSVLRLLKSIHRQTLDPLEYEVLVIANSEKDSTPSVLKNHKFRFPLRSFVTGKTGVNIARNFGIQKSRGEVLFFLDDDCELVSENHLENLLRIHRNLPEITALGGDYLPTGKETPVDEAYFSVASRWFTEGNQDFDDGKENSERHLFGGNVSYKKSHFQLHHLEFDESIEFGGAESELHRRMQHKSLGMEVIPLPVRHHLELRGADLSRKAYRQGYGSAQQEKLPIFSLDEFGGPLKFFNFIYQQQFRKGVADRLDGNAPLSNDLLNQSMEGVWGQLLFRLFYGLHFAYFVFHRAYWKSFNYVSRFVGFWKKTSVRSYWTSVEGKSLLVKVKTRIFWVAMDFAQWLRLRAIDFYWILHKPLKATGNWIYWRAKEVVWAMQPVWSYGKNKVYWWFYDLGQWFRLLGVRAYWVLGTGFRSVTHWSKWKCHDGLQWAVKLAKWSYWRLFETKHVLKMAAISFRWWLHSRFKAFANRIYWWGYARIMDLRLLGIHFYWKVHHFKNYMRLEFLKDVHLLWLRLVYGVNMSKIPESLQLADNPSLFAPMSANCRAACVYCPKLKAKAEGYYQKDEFTSQLGNLKSAGYSGVTVPCNIALWGSAELEKEFSSWDSEVSKEILLNPDPVKVAELPEKLKTLKDLGFKVLLLHRSHNKFVEAYKSLQNAGVDFQILHVFGVSGEIRHLYQSVYESDYSKIQLMSAFKDSPAVTDKRNRKTAALVSKAFGFLEGKSLSLWPKISHLHFPMSVGREAHNCIWPKGSVGFDSTRETEKKYSIVVPVRFQNRHACHLLRNFSRLDYSKENFEVVFVDDGNEMPLAPEIEATFLKLEAPQLQVKVVRWDRKQKDGNFDNNYRSGPARNLGIRNAVGERFLFIDSDILISPDLLFQLDSEMKDNMIVQFPRHMLSAEATSVIEKYDEIQLGVHTYSQNSYWEKFKSAENWMELKNYWKYTCTYGLGLTRKTLNSIGPFRSDYIFYGFEDVDLGYRLFQRQGEFKLVKSPVYHLYPMQEGNFHFDQQKRYDALSRSASIFFHKNFSMSFYFDLNGYLVKPKSERAKKPFHFFKYQLDKFRRRSITQQA